MKKITALLLSVLLVVSLVGCKTKTENGSDNTTATTATPVPTTVADNNSPTPTPEEQVVVTDTPEPVVTDAPEVTPPSEPSVSIDEVLNAYNDFMNVFMEDHYDETFETYRFDLAMIDEDDIPELLMIEDNYHACGAKVFTYGEDGKVHEVGEFGEYGSLAYTYQKNIIYSGYYGMGYNMLNVFRISDDYSAELLLASYIYIDENDVTTYSLEEEEVSEDEYYQALAPYWEYESTYIGYENAISYYNTCSYDRILALKGLYDALINGYAYEGYYPEDLNISGGWALERYELYDYKTNESYWGSAPENGYSHITVSDNNVGEYFFSSNDGDGYYYTYTDAKLDYLESGIIDGLENSDYCLKFRDENYGVTTYITDYTDDDGLQHLILCRFDDYEEQTLIAFYKSDYTPSGNKIYGQLTRTPEADADGKQAFLFEELLIITEDTDEAIKAEYGIASDLDGYDFEIVEKHDSEPLTIYLNDNTVVKMFDTDVYFATMTVDREQFYDYMNTFNSMVVSLYLNDDGSVEAIVQDYIN